MSDNVENMSFNEEFSTRMTIGIFTLVTRNVSDIDIPEPFSFSDHPRLFEAGDRESSVYSNQRVGSLNVHEMPMHFEAIARSTDSSGRRYSEYMDPSFQWAISQFWQPGHLKLHPRLPRESHLDPG
ncbi:MAG TPA: hypothetical protein VFG09_06055 [Thermodesulfovibrionales bacterium]|nr:hypothetical protein [Thermodesulfovibrionales bacterium]